MNQTQETAKPSTPDAQVSKASSAALVAAGTLDEKQAAAFQVMLEKGTSNASEWTVFFRGVLKGKEGAKP